MRIVALILMLCSCIVNPCARPHTAYAPTNYFPDGLDFVCVNGNNRYTRALYGGPSDYRLETSDRPIFAEYRKTGSRNIRLLISANDTTVRADSTDYCEARYDGVSRRYTLRHSAWGEGEVYITATAVEDTMALDVETRGFAEQPVITAISAPIKAKKLYRNGDLGVDPPDAFEPADDCADSVEATLVVAHANVGAHPCARPSSVNAVKDTLLHLALTSITSITSKENFQLSTPFLPPAINALKAAADGLWDGRTWMHGCIGWRMPLPGWRGAYVGDVLGMKDRQRTHFDAYAKSQVTDVEPTIPHPSQDTLLNLARAEKRWGTQMYSNGYICRNPERNDQMHHYNMNLIYIDQLLWHFCYDADTAYMRRMWPVITSHLDWEKRNFDPDDDGLYDAYCCIWASDALYYSGGAVTHSTAYNYRANRLAARIAELIGEDPAPYAAEADKIQAAMDARLWTGDHWAEYIEQMGYGRRHDNAALWSVYTPIDCNVGSAEQRYKATQYVDSCIPHIPVTAGLSTISTSNWQPYTWSINNVAPAEVMHMALAYFMAGRPDEGYRLMLANIIDQMYLGQSPGNYGQISRYDKARGECYRDFGDCIGISARTIYQGLYGIVPDALYGRCIIQPGLPAEWDSASIELPYISYTFSRKDGYDVYDITQNFAQPLQIILRQNIGNGHYHEFVGTTDKHQVITIPTWFDGNVGAYPSEFRQCKASLARPHTEYKTIDIADFFNASVTDIFRNEYRSPRPQTTTLQIPLQGVGDWCHPTYRPEINDSGFRAQIIDGRITIDGIPYESPAKGNDIAFTSLWDNYPDSLIIDCDGTTGSMLRLLLAGTTNHMQSGIDNGWVIVRYDDNTMDTLHLRNPDNWCPIEQDYYDDDYAFKLPDERPLRISLATGTVSRTLAADMGKTSPADQLIPGGAAQILSINLRQDRRVNNIIVKPLAPDIVIGLMAATVCLLPADGSLSL